jgi:hypothetical protein
MRVARSAVHSVRYRSSGMRASGWWKRLVAKRAPRMPLTPSAAAFGGAFVKPLGRIADSKRYEGSSSTVLDAMANH